MFAGASSWMSAETPPRKTGIENDAASRRTTVGAPAAHSRSTLLHVALVGAGSTYSVFSCSFSSIFTAYATRQSATE
jgi:hypothetical protein